jgi:hypothetical protein
MNEKNPTPTPPPLIPPVNPAWVPAGDAPLGSNPVEQTPVNGVFGAVEAMLRQPRRLMYQLTRPKPGGLIGSLLAIAIGSSLIYGVVAGTFSGGAQLWAAPVKILAGLLVSTLICLPSLYIFSCLGGSHARLADVFGLVAGLLALMTVLLIGFAPVAWVFSQSTSSLVAMGALHLVFWLVATAFGLRFLFSAFRHHQSSSYAGLRVWAFIFLLVALQMTTALRPIIGKSEHFLPAAQDKKFFVNYWMDCIDQSNSTNEQAAGKTGNN